MANPFFNAMGGANPTQNHFMQFMHQMQGKDPDAMINEMVRSGKISQAQLNQVQQQAQQMQGMLNGFRSMFGF